MSPQTTPRRSIAGSALSTPSFNPNGRSPQELTPTSKVKAMLAAVDDSSDSDSSVKLKHPSRKALSTIPGNVQRLKDNKSTETMIAKDAEQDEEEEEDDEDSLFLPRGRLAARLYAQPTVRQVSGVDEESDAAAESEDVYSRVKKRLLAEKAGTEPKVSSDSVNSSLEQGLNASAMRSRSRHSPALQSPEPLDSRPESPVDSSRSSPGLFLTPDGPSRQLETPAHPLETHGSDSNLPADSRSNSRFHELLARKRAQREAKQASEEKKKHEKSATQRSFEKQLAQDNSLSDMSDEDRVAEQRLTQQSRPARKASKRAQEEINRETQRMSRNMQLAHQAKTKKKITKDSLFARFNFRTSSKPNPETPQTLSSSTAASSAPASDLEEIKARDSPPTSPIQPDEKHYASSFGNVVKQSAPVDASAENDEYELPSMPDVMAQQASKLDNGKGKAIDYSEDDVASDPKKSKKTVFTQPPIKVRLPNQSLKHGNVDLDSESDVEVMPARKSRKSKVDVFDRVPAGKVQEGRSLQTLRALAHLNSPDKPRQGKKPTMSLGDMQTSLQKRARQQALDERSARIEDLKRRGIIVQSAEQRQQDQAEVEDLLEKARREGEEIMQKEKRAAKKQKVANGEVDDLPDTSDEDEDYQDEEEPDVELSGSEEDESNELNPADDLVSDAGEDPNEDEEGGVTHHDESIVRQTGLIDNEASEDGDDEEEGSHDVAESSDEDERSQEQQIQRTRRNKMVIDDDDDDDVENDRENAASATQKQVPPIEVPVFPMGASNLDPMPMGMTQAFAATMAPTQEECEINEDEQDSMAIFEKLPEPDFSVFDSYDSLNMVEDNQNDVQQQDTHSTSKDIDLQFSQSQLRYDLGNTQGRTMATQMSEIPDPTQDVGFVLSSPPPERFIYEPPSTVDTVLLPNATDDGSPVKKKRGCLQRRAIIHEGSSDADEETTPMGNDSNGIDKKANAFDAMRKARKEAKAVAAKEAFDKKKSEAKGMVEEQAQESEDEYAGLGGASDEDSGEEDEEVAKMMDNGEVDVDARKLAQFYANKERASDEKAIEKLYKDINSGMLRRKRGADLDLSDSEDDAERRRKRKQREFAKMRKALLADEKVGKIAEDPKKLAFLQSIEDRENDDDFDFLDQPIGDSFRIENSTQDEPDSQSQQPSFPAPAPNRRRHPLQESVPSSGNMRPPPSARRTAAPKKPATLAEIRESVSFLVEEPGSINLAPEPSSSASEDEGNNHQDQHRNPRRTSANPIIDRLSLRRAESTSTSTNSRLAFHDPAANPTIGGFKVPSLLRRATTSQLNANGADTNGISTAAATERAAGGGEKGDFIRRGGTKRSSVNFQSREKERMGAVQDAERRRREERERVARQRRSGLGGLGGGSFE